MWRGAKPAKAKVQAKGPVSGARELEKRLAESLEQQAATAEILRVIGTSPRDTQPVFDVIARSGVRVCGAHSCALFVVDGDMLRVAATHGVPAERVERFRTQFPMPLSAENHVTQVIHERSIFHLADIEHNPAATPQNIEDARLGRYHTRLMVPMVQGDSALGLIAVTSQSPAPFSDQQVALLQTFAAQAVIAIENVRLFKELQQKNDALTQAHAQVTEALDQQTATAEILRVISRSQTDVRPVFETIVRSAVGLCDSMYGQIFQFDGELIHLVAQHKLPPDRAQEWQQTFPRPVSDSGAIGRIVSTRAIIHLADVESSDDPSFSPAGRALMRDLGTRSLLMVPILRADEVMGVIVMAHREVDAFTETHVDLLKTFADQAVIALENVRLFTELGARNRELSTALDQQTATSDILRVISQSQTDAQPVFDTIVVSAVRLLGAYTGVLTRVEGDQIVLATLTSTDDTGDIALREGFPQSLHSEKGHAQVIRDRAPLNVADAYTDPRLAEATRARARARGYRSAIVVPLLRHDEALGAISLTRREPGGFTDDEIALLKTFADQAVIAIENVRLFTELREKNQALTVAHAQVSETLEQQTATAEILRVISSSPTDVQPVFDVIVERAVRLCGARFGRVYRFEGGVIHMVAGHGISQVGLGELQRIFPRPASDDTLVGWVILSRQPAFVRDIESDEGVPALSRRMIQALGARSQITIPMLRAGEPIGAMSLGWAEPGAFDEQQIALVKTFADQAVIAIENVRLFTELGARNRDLTEALEQQTATSEILRVMSRSQTDVQPVFDTIVRSAVKLCDGLFSTLYQFDGELIHFVAQHNFTPEALAEAHRVFPARPTRSLLTGRAILEREVVHIPDVELDPEFQHLPLTRALGQRSGLWVPMLREGTPIGVIVVARAEPGPFSDSEIELLKTFADQAVIAIENVRLFTELQASNRELTTALDTQTATSDILRVISQSQTNVQPVFDAIVASAVRLLGADAGSLTRVAGDQIELAAFTSTDDTGDSALRAGFPLLLHSEGGNAQVIRDRAPLNIADAQTDPRMRETMRAAAQVRGSRSRAVVPLLRHDEAVGTISVSRREPGGFTDDEIALLQTFADQAVIAIENVRLFNELEGRNRDLTATSEILRVISSSPTDVQPVFDTIVRSAVSLCDGLFSSLYQFDGELLHQVAQHNYAPEALEELHRVFPARPTRALFTGRAILERAVVHIPDSEVDPEHQHQALRRAIGWRSGLFVPMLREGAPVGVIEVARSEAGPFSDNEVELLKTFADQAVIAVENVRLFTELGARNRDLTEALEQQTATSEILRVISRSQTDVQPVFDTIVRSAVRLCDGLFSGLYQFDGEVIHQVAQHNFTPEGLEEAHRVFPTRPSRALGSGRAILDRAVVHIPDVEVDPEYQHQALFRAVGWRSGLYVPMLREGAPIGVIAVARAEPGPFSDSEIELLKTFADQAVIAVENVRLFKELQARTGELTRSVDQLTALGEISQAVSSTLDVETVLQTIVSRASQLAGADGCAIYEYDHATEAFHIRAAHSLDPALVEKLRASPLRKGEGAMGRAAETREATQVADIAAPGAYQSHIRDTLLAAGYRALLSVPLLREGEVFGSLSLNRHAPGEFPPEAVEVLKTFATQSALAIQNARLFREIADKSRQLEVASQHKSEFLANMSHELRTPLNAIIGFSEVLNERMFGELNEKQAEYLKDIHASGTHLLSLINDILDLSKVEAGRMELELSDFDLPAAVDNSVTLVRERASRKGITVRIAVEEQLGMLRGDERKIRQVLLNLLSNAIKFTPEGGRIDVTAVPNGGAIEVSVRDTGVGIAPEDHEAVFEEFRQVGASAAKQEGTGLGLALARKFIELHGGKIWVKSQVGAGSTFTFTLPFQQSSGA